MYAQEYEDPAVSKKKIVLVSVIMGIIILALICVLISAIIRKNHLASSAKPTNPSVTASVDDTANTPANSNLTPVSNDASSTNGSTPASASSTSDSTNTSNTSNTSSSTPTDANTNSSNTESSSSNKPVATSSKTEIPTTGPESSLVGLALLLGSGAAYLFSRRLAASA